MREKILIIFAGILLLIIVACFFIYQNNEKEAQIKYEELSYLESDYSIEKKGYKIQENKKDCYIIISAGMKKTGGYDVVLKSIEGTKDDMTIYVKEETPGASATVTMSITYPCLVIKLDNKPENLKVINKVTNEEYKLIN